MAQPKENATYDGVDIKQADANLLSYPLEIVTDAAKVRQDLNYYQPRYSKEGLAMGAAILAVLYCRLGDYNKGLKFFLPAINPMKCHRLVWLQRPWEGPILILPQGREDVTGRTERLWGLKITDQGIEQKQGSLPKRMEKNDHQRCRQGRENLWDKRVKQTSTKAYLYIE